MLQSFFARNSFPRINSQAPFQQISQIRILKSAQSLHFFHPPNALLRTRLLRPIKLVIFSCKPLIFFLRILTHPIRNFPRTLLNHSQMFIIFMSLIEQFPSNKFHNNASYAPNIRDFAPLAALQNNLRGPILSRINNRRMMVISKRGPPKIDNFYLISCIFMRHILIFFSIFLIRVNLHKIRILKQYIFRLQIRMC